MENNTTKTKQLEVQHQQSQKTKYGKRTGNSRAERKSRVSEEKKKHFQQVKEENKRSIRNLLLENGVQGIADLAGSSGLSYPTVSALIGELADEGQVRALAETESRGGRPGLRYEIDPSYRQGLVLTLMAEGMQGLVYDAAGTLIGEYQLHVEPLVTAKQLAAEIVRICKKHERITDIALGIPGAVHEQEIIHLPRFPKLLGGDLAAQIREQTNASLYLENDLNAIVLTEVAKYHDFAHIAWIGGCIGVGIVLDGQVIKGSQGYAGEVDALFAEGEPEEERLAKCITALTCVLNLPHIIVSGEIYQKELLEAALEKVGGRMPKERIPQLHMAEDTKELCRRGLRERIWQAWKSQC